MATWVLPKSPRLSGAPEYGAEPLPAADWRLCGSYWWKKMKDDFRTLEQVLRQATAPNGAPQSDLGFDAKGLREAWLALGEVLEAAQPADGRLATCPTEACNGHGRALATCTTEYRLAACPTERLPPRAWRRWPLAAAAALVLCVVIGLAVYGRRAGPATAGRSVAAGGPVAAADGRNKAAAGQPPARSDAGPLQWDDSLDEQIVAAGEGMALAQSELAHRFEPAELVRYQVGQVLQDVEKSKL